MIPLLLLPGCRTDEERARGRDGDTVRLEISLRSEDGVKSIFGSEVENLQSAVIAVYNASDGSLVKQFSVRGGSGTSVVLSRDSRYDFRAVANIGYVSIDGSSTCDFVFPSKEQDAAGLEYLFDGDSVSYLPGYRRETFSDVASFGIPLSASLLNVDVNTSGSISLSFRRLFSKISLYVDYTALTAGGEGVFANEDVRIRGANARLNLFGSSAAKSSADVLQDSDYEPIMTDKKASGTLFTFYVPENMQGDDALVDSNGSRSRENVKSSKRPLLTYIEYKGELLSPSPSGLTGELAYRFYLGKDSGGNFDVPGNWNSTVTLAFNTQNILQPCWSVSSTLDSSARGIFLTSPRAADPDAELPDGQALVVRPDRPAQFRLVLRNGDPSFPISRARLLDEGQKAPDFSTLSWTSDFIFNVRKPRALKELESIGLALTYNAATGEGSVYVADRVKAAANYGKSVTGSFSLVRQDADEAPKGRSVSFILLDNQTYAFLHPNGIAYDASRMSLLNEKTDADAFYIGQEGRFYFPGRTCSYSAELVGQRVDKLRLRTLCTDEKNGSIYVAGINSDISSNGPENKSQKILFTPSDPLNDDPMEAELAVRIPRLQWASPTGLGEMEVAMLDICGTRREAPPLMICSEDRTCIIDKAYFRNLSLITPRPSVGGTMLNFDNPPFEADVNSEGSGNGYDKGFACRSWITTIHPAERGEEVSLFWSSLRTQICNPDTPLGHLYFRMPEAIHSLYNESWEGDRYTGTTPLMCICVNDCIPGWLRDIDELPEICLRDTLRAFKQYRTAEELQTYKDVFVPDSPTTADFLPRFASEGFSFDIKPSEAEVDRRCEALFDASRGEFYVPGLNQLYFPATMLGNRNDLTYKLENIWEKRPITGRVSTFIHAEIGFGLAFGLSDDTSEGNAANFFVFVGGYDCFYRMYRENAKFNADGLEKMCHYGRIGTENIDLAGYCIPDRATLYFINAYDGTQQTLRCARLSQYLGEDFSRLSWSRVNPYLSAWSSAQLRQYLHQNRPQDRFYPNQQYGLGPLIHSITNFRASTEPGDRLYELRLCPMENGAHGSLIGAYCSGGEYVFFNQIWN